MTGGQPTVLVALASLAAEGTPRMTLSLCREWSAKGIRPVVVVLNAEPADLAPDFTTLGVDMITLDISKSGLRRYAVLAWEFFVIARSYRAQALLSMPFGWHVFMALGARLGGVRSVAAHVGNYPNAASRRGLAKFCILVQLGRPLTNRLICCSRYVQMGVVQRFRVKKRETAIVYNGTDAREFVWLRPKSECEPKKPFVIGMVARLEKHKDHATLIRAARILKDRGRNIAVNIVGDGSQRDRLQRLIESEGLSEVINLFGMRRDIPNVLANFDVFAFSTTPDEGFGIALVEAMLAGIPIVASNVGACREVLDEGRLGILVSPADPLALADAIDAIISKPDDARIRSIEARSKAFDNFSAEAMACAYGDILGFSSFEELKERAAYVPELSA